VLPPESTHVDAEAELALVIGAEGRRVAERDALELVAGYTAANDVTARDLQARDGQWLRAKGFDTFCPLLPAIVRGSELGEASSLRVVQRLNGGALQTPRRPSSSSESPGSSLTPRPSSRCGRAI
jgi:5-carboxymethyl-2-hydroxymuconate isomerase